MSGFDASEFGAVPIGTRKKGTRAPVEKRIWERFIKLSLDGLDTSIEQAIGRFDTTDSSYAPYDKPKASKNWKLANSNKIGDGDWVLVYFKCGKSKKIALFANNEETMKVPATSVVATLRKMREFIASPNFRNSADGRMFHKMAVEVSKPKRNMDEYRFDDIKDMWVKK